jgi:hypothetical protein
MTSWFVEPLRSGRRSPDMALPVLVASSVGSTRSSLAPTWVEPLRSGRRSPDMALPVLVASSVGSTRSSLAPTFASLLGRVL